MPRADGKTVFDQAAELYGRARPAYPEEMVEDVISWSRIPPEGRILEIGCGAGQATCMFARHGYRMLCVEPGANLIAVTREKCRPYGEVEFVHSSFEDWEAEESAFNLTISGSAFHWLDPDIAFAKIAKALVHHGTLALFWNKHPGVHLGIFAEMQSAYRAHAPQIARESTGDEEERFEQSIRDRAKQIEDTGLFEDITVKRYPWSKVFTTSEYLDLLDTYSDHRTLPQEQKYALFGGIAEIIDLHGGSVQRDYLTTLYLARRKI